MAIIYIPNHLYPTPSASGKITRYTSCTPSYNKRQTFASIYSIAKTLKKASQNTSFSAPGTLGHKVFNRIVREELLELAVELCRQSFIMRDDQRRFIQLLDDICHREGFTGAGNAEKCLALVAFLKTFYQLLNGLGLVAGGFIFQY